MIRNRSLVSKRSLFPISMCVAFLVLAVAVVWNRTSPDRVAASDRPAPPPAAPTTDLTRFGLPEKSGEKVAGVSEVLNRLAVLGVRAAEETPPDLVRYWRGPNAEVQVVALIHTNLYYNIFDRGEYYVFRGNARTATFAGSTTADTPICKYSEPCIRIESLEGEPRWLVVTTGGCNGTGVSIYWESWYDFTDPGMPQVFGMTTDGHCLSPDLSEFTEARNIRTVRSGGDILLLIDRWKRVEKIDLDTGEESTLLDKSGIAAYRYDPARRKFLPDEPRSDWTAAQLQDIWSY